VGVKSPRIQPSTRGRAIPSTNLTTDQEPPAKQDDGPLFNTVDEVAAKLRIDRKTAYDAIARGEIPVVRIGRVLRIPGAWLRRVAT
jgi:excisionase family DNA binding protein